MDRQSILVVTLGLMLAFGAVLAGCATAGEEEVAEENGVQHTDHEGTEEENTHEDMREDHADLLVYTSLYPLYDFSTKIAGDHVEVVNLIPAGAEPHDYEPTPNDVIELHEADVFVYNGSRFEFWIEDILDAVDHEDMIVVDSTKHIDSLSLDETGPENGYNDHGHEHDENSGHNHDYDGHGDGDHNHDHVHGEHDPHVWVDPLKALQQAEAIKNGLVEADPHHAQSYENNYEKIVERIEQLDASFQEMRDNVERRDFVVSHAAFGHLAERYDLNQVAITGLNPSSEPSSGQLQEMIEFVEENEIEYILFENQVTPNVVQVVKEEVGAESLVLHNLEVVTEEELATGEDYFSLMEQNLDVLKTALGYEE